MVYVIYIVRGVFCLHISIDAPVCISSKNILVKDNHTQVCSLKWAVLQKK